MENVAVQILIINEVQQVIEIKMAIGSDEIIHYKQY